MGELSNALRRVALVAGCLLALALAQQAQAANGSCSFRANGTMTLAFGSIDPSSAANAVASVTPNTFAQVGNCRNGSMQVFADNGQNPSGGSRRLSNGGTDFIPYTLTVPATGTRPGNNRWVTWAITGTITPANFQNATAGTYSDSVVITVIP